MDRSHKLALTRQAIENGAACIHYIRKGEDGSAYRLAVMAASAAARRIEAEPLDSLALKLYREIQYLHETYRYLNDGWARFWHAAVRVHTGGGGATIQDHLYYRTLKALRLLESRNLVDVRVMRRDDPEVPGTDPTFEVRPVSGALGGGTNG